MSVEADIDRTRVAGGGVVAGVTAYLAGYAVTYVATASTIRNSLTAGLVELITGEPATWKLVGWVFYNAHLVDAVVPGLVGSRAVNLIDAGDAIPGWLYLVPVVFLVASGASLSRAADSGRASDAALAGAAVVAGYLPLSVVGAFLFTLRAGEAAARPDLVAAVALAGVVYPVVLGGVGGAVGSLAR